MAIVAQAPRPSPLSQPLVSRRDVLPVPDEDARRHSARVLQRVLAEIDAGGGWLSFARYMELVLHEPGLGYYAAGAAKFGQAGDFVTAPELSPLFARTLAGPVGEVIAQTGGEVLELGAGSGRLAGDLLAALRDAGRLPSRYLILETSPELAQRQRQTLDQQLADPSIKVEWIDRLPDSFEGIVVANEVLDALPVHIVAWHEDGPHERGVVRGDDGLAWLERPLAPGPLREAAAAIDVPAGYVSEISLAVPALVEALSRVLRRGVLLFVDYGFGRREFYHPQRNAGTLMCHYRHRAHADPFFLPGLQDITAHVDFTAVADAGTAEGLQLLVYTTQARFLVNAGVTRLLERNSTESEVSYLRSVAAAQKLLSPAEMGELFKVIALGRGVGHLPDGFASGDMSRLL